MNPALPIKCIPYINVSKRGVNWLTRRFKSDDSSSDNDKDNSKKYQKNQGAIDKLNELLKTMKKGNDNELNLKVLKNVELAKPRELARKAENQPPVDEAEENQQLGEKLADAASSVARSIGGNIEKTESELLSLLRIYNSEPNDPSEKKPRSSVQLDDLLSGMKIDRSQPTSSSTEFKNVDRAQRVRDVLSRGPGLGMNQKVNYRKPMDNYVPINLFSNEPLNIFKNVDKSTNCPTLSTWEELHKKSLKSAVTHPPKNIYEQMIIWTEQGKLWKFPIDNEQGMNDERNVFFAEHVFLEPLLDEWCPTKGPIRHFMELVCVGLSKNPFLSVEEKKDHINWFRQYFYEKNQILKDTEALEIKSLPENVKDYYKPTIPE